MLNEHLEKACHIVKGDEVHAKKCSDSKRNACKDYNLNKDDGGM